MRIDLSDSQKAAVALALTRKVTAERACGLVERMPAAGEAELHRACVLLAAELRKAWRRQ